MEEGKVGPVPMETKQWQMQMPLPARKVLPC
jgi:hypothetical protein